MLVRRANWWIVLAVAVLGPLFGAAAATGLSWDWDCNETNSAETASTSADKTDEPTAAPVELPDGESVALQDLAPERPKAIVVMKGPWCDVCRRQLRVLSEGMHRLQMEDAAVFGLTHADPSANRELMEELELNFPVLSDADEQLLRELDLWMDQKEIAMPGVIFVDGDGAITRIHRGRYPGKPQEQLILETLSRMD